MNILDPLWRGERPVMRQGEAELWAYDRFGKAVSELNAKERDDLAIQIQIRLLAEKWTKRK